MSRSTLRTVIPRVVALAVTTWLLAATSYIREPRCSEQTEPVIFLVAGDCGPGGVIVVETEPQEGQLWIDNAEILGLPPAPPRNLRESWRQNSHGVYTGALCPFDLRGGNWEVYGRGTHRGAGDAGARDPGSLAAPVRPDAGSVQDTCQAGARSDGDLDLTCLQDGEVICRARLSPRD